MGLGLRQKLRQFNRDAGTAYRRHVAPPLHRAFYNDLVRHTRDFSGVKWMGTKIWQDVMDLWTIQETIAEVKPELLIETGTHHGGSSLFYAHLLDLMGHGSIITVDIEKLHNLSHPRITYLIGSSTSDDVIETIRRRVQSSRGPVMVILDSVHARDHVARELELYAPLVTPGSYCLVEDGVIDTMSMFRRFRPGPIPAIKHFLKSSADFELDRERTRRFLVTHHPMGWLKRKSVGS
jgi:cephalosporin hydroxylase